MTNDNDNNKPEEIAESLSDNGVGSEESVEQVAAQVAVADATVEQPAPERIPTPRCPFCMSYLFVEGRSGVNTFNIQMGVERVRIFTCAMCECVLPIQVMMIDQPMIAAPGPTGGRLLKM